MNWTYIHKKSSRITRQLDSKYENGLLFGAETGKNTQIKHRHAASIGTRINYGVRFNESWFVFHDFNWSFHKPYFNIKHIFHKLYRVNRIQVIFTANKYQIIP